ncbi:hypothetical protein [Accumulibacter sp.]|uniref:hypothetical protein n=1 Tax=Accumulibacter sp. TaxID=2053492 RepID=UPI0025F1CBD9|nr:hypothetical protein [Accumulibacter sp.]MCM8594229.1 hypothetical protein [Accumulibacter sp.]MCM8625795.1 hypothetical protein [Accumulibacter sp.]MDS4048372.1 hypothetical protein [Accumulibacter sp.]
MALLVFRGGCPVTEAYLAYLSLHEMRPALILAIDYVGDGPRSERLRRLVGTGVAARLQRIRRNRAARVPAALAETLQRSLPVVLTPGREPDYEAVAQRVLRLTVDNYADPRLLKAMRDCGVRTFLYCSGGRVPAAYFKEDLSILHIHPGVVPHVRGSDGLLWSMLARGRPGCSCFYMDAGIDTGRLIATAEYEPPRWSGLRADADGLYHALLYCYDPHLRAALLISVLERLAPGQDLAALETAAQPHGGGHYYTMHPELRARVLARLFG